MSFLLRHRRHPLPLLRHLATASPSSVLSPSDPSAVLSSKQKSFAAISLLKQHLPSSSTNTATATSVDPSAVLSICSAAALSPLSSLDRDALLLAVQLLSPHHPAAIRSLISSHLLHPQPPSDRQLSFAITLFGHARLLPDALALFSSHPSTSSLNALLLAAIIAGDHPAASRFFSELPAQHNLAPDTTTFNTLLKSFAESGSTRSAYSLLDEMRRRNIPPNATFFNNALSGFYREERFDDVSKVLTLMKQSGANPQSVPTYNVRIEGLCKLKRTREAKDLFMEMCAKKIKPNWVTYSHLIVGFCKEGELEEAKSVYEEMGRTKVEAAQCECYFSLIHYLCQGGDYEGALKVCRDVMGKNWVPRFKTMRMLVNGLVNAGKVEEGKELVETMKERFPSRADMWKEIEEGFPQ